MHAYKERHGNVAPRLQLEPNQDVRNPHAQRKLA